MAKLIYAAIASVDGCIEDPEGKFDWGEPDEEGHAFINELVHTVGTHLYGRRLYDVMAYWETATFEERYLQDFADIWRSADKIVYSRTLENARSARTRIEREFDADVVRALKAEAERDVLVGGAELAAEAFKAGLVDEVRLFLAPVLVGGGKRALPDGLRLDLELLDERSFRNGMVHLRYRTVTT
jgi:dihydrofolate reductase